MTMRIAMTGSSGMIGRALIPVLEQAGLTVVRLKQGEPWDVAFATPVDAVIHLAGEGIAKRRWTPAQKQCILKSRVDSTRTLVELISRQSKPPKTFISASATGFYGDRGNALLTETSAPGTGFLPQVCQAWESASFSLLHKDVRVVHLRLGIVLSAEGGALPVMRVPFFLGVGGPLGSGRQWMSWVSLRDLLSIFEKALFDNTLHGPINAVSPQPVTNQEFSQTLARVLHRPCVFRLPAWAARFALGEMANELLLASTRVAPAILNAYGFSFQYPQLDVALRHALGLEK